MAIRFAMEAPTTYLDVFTPKTDLDFCLAHKVLEDKGYSEHFARRHTCRELILDNSFHELREALPFEDLHEAANRCRANYIIAPDNEADPDWTLEQFKSCYSHSSPFYLIAGVLVGPDVPARKRLLDAYSKADMLCLPFRHPRLEWYKEVPDSFKRIHLLGLSTLPEMREWASISKRRIPSRSFSMDTAKPIKWGLVERLIDDGLSLRNASISSKDLLDIEEINPAQMACVEYNISVLRKDLA